MLDYEMYWMQAYNAALMGGATTHEATLRADHGIAMLKARFPRTNGNG